MLFASNPNPKLLNFIRPRTPVDSVLDCGFIEFLDVLLTGQMSFQSMFVYIYIDTIYVYIYTLTYDICIHLVYHTHTTYIHIFKYIRVYNNKNKKLLVYRTKEPQILFLIIIFCFYYRGSMGRGMN